jgi:hypothetical protein
MFAGKVDVADQPLGLPSSSNIEIDTAIATKRRLKKGCDSSLRLKLGQSCGWVLNTLEQDWKALATRLFATSQVWTTLADMA